MRLNRTMQYGNFARQNFCHLKISCLNRTMQYGNLRKMKTISGEVSGLNRTMQYGNYISIEGEEENK